MQIINFFINNKAKLFYIILVLVFNIAAGIYLLSFSSISFPTIHIPDFNLIFSDAKQKLAHVLIFPSPTPSEQIKYILPKVTPEETPSVSIAPTATESADVIDCIGPDGKHLLLTQKDCDAFNAAWKITPTMTISPNASPSAATN